MEHLPRWHARYPSIVLGLFLALALPWTAAAQDNAWFGTDKVLHGSLSFVGTLGLGLGAQAMGVDPHGANLMAGTLVLGLGLGKEALDALRPRGTGWSWKDLFWDMVGISLAMACHRYYFYSTMEP